MTAPEWIEDEMTSQTQEQRPARRPLALRLGKLLFSFTAWTASIAAALMLLTIIIFLAAPRVMGLEGLVVLTGSMEPEIPVGGMVFIKDVDPNSIHTGDVITYGEASISTTHRVVEVVNDPVDGLLFRTKGDNNDAVDTLPVLAASVRGKASFTLPQVGYLVDALKDRGNFYLFIGLPAALLVLNELVNIARDMRNPGTARSTRKEASA
ncbi:MAG: signal peptidase I [Dehalococcoidia bacterium]|nr:signal peptidase I [Dehalococcoidia bacterium]